MQLLQIAHFSDFRALCLHSMGDDNDNDSIKDTRKGQKWKLTPSAAHHVHEKFTNKYSGQFFKEKKRLDLV